MDDDDTFIDWTNYVMFWVIVLVIFALGLLIGWLLHARLTIVS